jgi:hypothetical protein
MELVGLGILLLLVLAAVLFAATIPLLWFLIAVALFFSGAIGPAFGCVLLGVLAGAISMARSP